MLYIKIVTMLIMSVFTTTMPLFMAVTMRVSAIICDLLAARLEQYERNSNAFVPCTPAQHNTRNTPLL